MTQLDWGLEFYKDNHQFLNMLVEIGNGFTEAIFRALGGKRVDHVMHLLAHVEKPFCELKNKADSRSILFEVIDLGNVELLEVIAENYEMNNHCQIDDDIDPVSKLQPLHCPN